MTNGNPLGEKSRGTHPRASGGTSIEELIEGLSIGVGAAIIGIAIAIDNLSEGLSIGELIRGEASSSDKRTARRVLGWTGLIGFAVLSSTLLGWFLLRDLTEATLSFLFATGAGGMFYLTITDLLPESEERHYQQSSALAVMAGFVIIFVLSQFT